MVYINFNRFFFFHISVRKCNGSVLNVAVDRYPNRCYFNEILTTSFPEVRTKFFLCNKQSLSSLLPAKLK